MNTPLRRVAQVALVLFLALLVAATSVQVIQAPKLNADPRNKRTLYREFGNFRGSIIVGDSAIALSKPSDDPYGYQRTYTDGELYAPATGFYSVVVGRSGMERYANDTLNGTSDALWWNRLQNLVSGKDPQGSSVELTLQAKVQQAAADALGDQRGAVVAINVKTGAILAMVSTPSYDPNKLAGHNASEAAQAYQDLLEADGDPLINRAIAGDTYPPGSVFKLVTAATALQSGQFTADSTLDGTSGYTLPGTSTVMHNFGGGTCTASGTITLADALRISCNTAFAELGNTLGQDAIRAQADAFGFDSDLSIPLSVTASRYPEGLDDAQTALSAIGQGSVRVTPLQVAMVTAAIANKGVMMKPYLQQTVRSPDLSVVSQTEATELGTPISASTAATLTEMMIDVVKSGTGTKAQISGVTVAGKSGTAQTTEDAAPHAWFTAFAPAEDPEVAVAVVVENGGSLGSEATGGAVAAPIARDVLQAAIDR